MGTTFSKSIDAAVHDQVLTGALTRFSETYRLSRAKAYASLDFEATRTRIAEVKGYAAQHLDELVAEFTRTATARGVHVFHTRSPESVIQYILDLARERGVKRIVKSKSMATEEIHLNQKLEAAGLDVKETDLGEWILQLAGQRPSHMVMPAIHLTKEQVTELFSKEVNERLAADIPQLVKVARAQLREKFLAADLGISGANVAIAETGTLVLVTNEGNARLVTTLPKIHVAVVGVEKLVAKLEDALPILKALPRSATGQLLTSYLSFITGPTPNTDGTDKELHVILMDNHRSEMAADPRFKEALQCIRCGSCLNVCPVYRLVGGHVFGKVYTGGIGTILTAWFDTLKQAQEIQALCIACGSCKEVCPGKIDIPELIVELRRRVTAEQGLPFVQRAIFSVVNNRRLFHGMLRAASLVQKPFAKKGFIRHLPMFLSGLTDLRSLPEIAPRPLRDLIQEIEQPKGLTQRAALYAGCLMDFAYPEMGAAVVKILNQAGIEVVFPEGQTCCGAPARYSGAYDVAASNALNNIDALLSEKVDHVVCACPTCTVGLKKHFGEYLQAVGNTEALVRARQVADKAVDFSTLVKKLVDEKRLTLKAGRDLGALTYHDSCHFKRTLHAEAAPRELLTRAGARLTEMEEADMCCGMGGSYSIKMPTLSTPMLERKLKNIDATGAKVTATDCPGCVMQMRGGFDARGRTDVKVLHTVELLADAFE
jgi:L-lactate dehydrogenase complex protein LldF